MTSFYRPNSRILILTTVLTVLLPLYCSHPQISFSDRGTSPIGAFPTAKRPRPVTNKKAQPEVTPASVPAPTQTSTLESDNALRAKLCPNLSQNVAQLFRYDRVTKKCYRGGDRGPCGQNMIFYAEDESRVYGICDCDARNYDRQLIFHPDTNQCYFVYSRGYCSAKKWLIFNQEDRPVCGFNPCYRLQKEATPGAEYVPYRGRCLKLGSPVEECEDGKVLTFIKDRILPVCAVERTSGVTGLTVSVPRFRCSPGSAQSIGGKCKAIIKLSIN